MSSKVENYLVGSDPEWFLLNKSINKIISAEGLLGGSKKDPRPVGDGYFVQEDNVAAEGNIPPAASREAFVGSISEIKKRITDLLAADIVLHDYPVGYFTSKEVSTKQGSASGCDPDINAWNGELNSPATFPKGNPARYAGGHIMIGYDGCNDETSFNLIQAMDLFLGVPSVLLDSERERRNLYGMAGSCRIKDFGVEYRVLSNFWTQNEAVTDWAYSGVEQAIDFVNKGKAIDTKLRRKIIKAVDFYDERVAKSLSKEFNLV